MGIYSSGSINFSQLGSETDFKQLISDLSKIETKYANKLLKWRADWKERMEGFTTIRTELQNLRNSIATLNTVDKFMAKSAASSNESVATAKATSEAKAGSYNISVKQLATRAIWSINTGLTAKTDMVNPTNSTQEFWYSYKGEQRKLDVPAYTTLDGLQRLINSDAQNLGVTASLVQSSTGIYFQLSGNATGSEATLSIDNVGSGLVSNLQLQAASRWSHPNISGVDLDRIAILNHTFTSKDNIINTTAGDQTFKFKFTPSGGSETEMSFTVPSGATLDDLVNIINNGTGTNDPKAEIKYGTGGVVQLWIGTNTAGDVVEISDGTLPGFEAGINPASNWEVQNNQNAMIRANGIPAPPHWLQKDSNKLTDVIEGLEINVRAVGDTTFTVELDKASLYENVEKFVEAVNKFRTAIKALSDVDTNKTTMDPELAESQFEMQMGGVLTGNYGVQTVSSKIKQAIASSPSGFVPMNSLGAGIGDVFTSLSQVGIMTCATEGDANFGLLVINDTPNKNGSLTLAEAIEKDAMAVAELFAAHSQGVSHSPFFNHASHVQGSTKPGTYEVVYTTTIDPGTGEKTVTGTINGSPIKYYEDSNSYGIDPANGGTSNAAYGLLIQITDFAPTQRSGYVSIRDGMANTLLNMFDGPDGMLSKEKGPLTILENNYKKIIANIDDKLLKEDERLARWERTMQLKFSRLETTLGTYNKMQEAVKSMVKQLATDSS